MSYTYDLREFDKISDNIYKAVIASAKRARQVHQHETEELKRQLGELDNEEELDELNVDREAIVKEFDKKEKPSMIAIHEFLDKKLKVTGKYIEEDN